MIIKKILFISFLTLLVVSCSKDDIEVQDGDIPQALTPCEVSEVQSNYDSTEPSKLEFANLQIHFLNELTHALAVLKIVFVNQDKTLASFKNTEKEQSNTHFTLMSIGPDVFDNADITTNDKDMSTKFLGEQIINHELFEEDSEIGILINETIIQSYNLQELAFEIDELLASEDMQSELNQNKVSILLDNCVILFDCIFKRHTVISATISNSNTFKGQESRLEYHISDWHSLLVTLSNSILEENQETLESVSTALSDSLMRFNPTDYRLVANNNEKLAVAIDQIDEMLNAINTDALDPDEEDCYRGGYYRYNKLILRYVNSISPGFVGKLNRILENEYDSYLRYADMPQYFERLTN